jgi:hypothetical protein
MITMTLIVLFFRRLGRLRPGKVVPIDTAATFRSDGEPEMV